jgi:predicted nucleic acid-binding protein
LRVVLDTNALIRATGRTSTRARRIFEEILRGGHQLIVSNEMPAEVTILQSISDIAVLHPG